MTIERDIRNDLVDMVDLDGANAGEIIDDLADEYGVPRQTVADIYDEMNRL